MPTRSTRKNPPKSAETTRMAAIVVRLKEIYPDAVCALEWGGQYGGERDDLLRESWKLLVMGRLSAQCTDARVYFLTTCLPNGNEANMICSDFYQEQT